MNILSVNSLRRRDFENSQWGQWSITAKKQFQIINWASSAKSDGEDDSKILFFEPFLTRLIPLDEARLINVTPKTFAAAFLEFDIEQRAKIICSEVFNQEELNIRDQTGTIDRYPEAKIVAVKHVAKWMGYKYQNPWDYLPSIQVDALTSEENIAVDRALRTFANVSLPEYLPTIQEADAAKTETRLHEMNYCCTEYNRILNAIADGTCTYLGNTAQTAENLTILSLRNLLTDTFVDAVQFSKRRIGKATRTAGIAESANVLFRKYWAVDYKLKGKILHRYEDFCPVKRLAIIRAVAYLQNEVSWSGDQFDSSIAAHNLFLTPEEIFSIHAFINEELRKDNALNDIANLEMDTLMSINAPDPNTQSTFQTVVVDNQLQIANGNVNNMTGQSIPTIMCLPSTSNNSSNNLLVTNGNQSLMNGHQNGNNGITENPMVFYLQPQVEITLPRDNSGNIIFHGHVFTPDQWETIGRTFRTTQGNLVETGKRAYDVVFPNDDDHNFQMKSRTLKNSVPKPLLPEDKRLAVIDALKYIRAIETQEELRDLQKPEEDQLKEVFIWYRNSKLQKIKKQQEKATQPNKKQKF